MSTQQPSPEWEDTIDLRKWIDALFRYKWLILACTVIAVTVATIYSYVVQVPTFESSGGASLPPANADGGLGLTLRGYQEFAASTPVMDSVSQKLGLEPDAGRLRAQYRFQLEDKERFITVTAAAETSEQAFLLASRWIEAYDEQVQAKIREQFNSLRDEASRQLESLTPELEATEDNLARFDLAIPIGSLDTLLSSLEEELIRSETQLRGLLDSSQIPNAASLEYLEGTLPGGSGSVGGGGSPGIAARGGKGSLEGAKSVDSTLNDSTYLELSQALARVRLSSLENELGEGESRLRELTLSAIPIDEARIGALEDALAAEPRILMGGPGINRSGLDPSADNATVGEELLPNPVYVALAQELAETRVRLAASRREAETLEDRISNLLAEGEKLHGRLATGISILRDQAKDLRSHLSEAKNTRNELDREVTRLREAHNPALAELDRLLEIEPRLVTLASLSTIREPAVPTKPVAPQRTRNISLAAVLGLMLGVFGAFFLEYYRTTAPAARPSDE